MSNLYPNLFSPGKIGNLTLKNRIMKAPQSSGMSNKDGTVSERLIRYSDLSLEAIAAECGFGCYANYFKACKKARGVAPGRIAEKIRGE